MTRARSIPERVRRCIDRLYERLESETLQPHADAVPLTTIVGAYHKATGLLEERLDRRPLFTAHDAAREVRVLRAVVRTHALLRKLRHSQRR